MSPKLNLLKLLFFTIICCSVLSENLFAEYRFDSWTTDDGLPQNGVLGITQTDDGYLWFTTFDGLVRFDGVKFTVFNKSNTTGIINNRFTGIFNDENKLYLTAENGVLTSYENGVFHSFTPKQLRGSYVKWIKKDENGRVLFWVDGKGQDSWYYFKDGKLIFKEIDRSRNLKKYEVKGKLGTRWLIYKNKIVEEKDGKEIFYSFNGKERDLSDINYLADKYGGLWVGKSDLSYFKDGKVKVFSGKDELPVNSDYHGFWEEADGSIWVFNGSRSTAGVGLVRYKNGKISIFGKNVGLTDTNIKFTYRDKEKNLWIGTSKGLNRLKKPVIKSLSKKDGLIDVEVYPIYRNRKNRIWIGTARGLSYYENGKIHEADFSNTSWTNKHQNYQALLEDSNGKLWLGIIGVIAIYHNGKIDSFEKYRGTTAYGFWEDEDKRIWATTDKGILVFKDYKLERKYTAENGLANNHVNLIYKTSNGDLWFGGYGGLSKFKDGKFTNYTKKEGLTGNYVRTIYEDAEGTLWIGTYDEGLSRFKDGKFTNFKKKDGLFSDGVFAIQEDKFENFWISSNQGIYRIKKQHLNDFADEKIRKLSTVGYGKEDGMLNNECNGGRQPASIVDENGHFWFPTQDGVAIVNPEAESTNALPPKVVIESATVERNPIDIKNGLKIEPGQGNIAINFTGISFMKSNQIKFQYKLVGHDKDWIDAGTRRTAYYSHLHPGEYKFQVKAINSNGVWSQNNAGLEIILKPHFYQTKSFYALIVLTLLLLLLLIWRISVFQLKRRQKLLERLVKEKTTELKLANEELKQLANSDGLTAVGNRRRFEQFLADEWHRAIRFKTEISLILLDIDHFKLYNDTYGHQAGDDALKIVAEALTKTIHRPTDLVARFGGEEFAIILGGTDLEGALQIAELAENFIKELKISHETSKTSEILTVSIGVATMFVSLGMEESELIERADKALYEAKESGRNQIKTFNNLDKMPIASDTIQEDFTNIN